MLKELSAKYLKGQSEITRRLRIIERHENVIERIRDKSWTDEFIRPIMEAVKCEFPDITWDDERLVPMGLRNNVSVFGKTKKPSLIHLRFTPSGLLEGYISLDIKLDYRDGHGFGSKSEVIKDIQQVFDYIKNNC